MADDTPSNLSSSGTHEGQELAPSTPSPLPSSPVAAPAAAEAPPSSGSPVPPTTPADASDGAAASSSAASAPPEKPLLVEPRPVSRTAFGDVVTSSAPLSASSSASSSSSTLAALGPLRASSPSSSPLSAAPAPVPLKRPPPPKKGILKPARPPPRGLLNSLIRPLPSSPAASVVGRFLSDGPPGAGGSAPAPPSSPSSSPVSSTSAPAAATSGPYQAATVVGSAVQQGGERAGAFFSKAFTRLSSVATGQSIPQAAAASARPPVPPKSPASTASSPNRATQPAPQHQQPAAVLRPALRKATFPLANLAITYPISSATPPSTPLTAGQIAEIERLHLQKRAEQGGVEWWTERRVGEVFELAVRCREEGVDEAVLRAVKAAAPPPPAPRTLDLANLPLSHFTLAALSDVLSLHLGLQKVDLSSTNLSDENLTTILCALLRSAEVRALVLRDNRRLKLSGWRALAAFLLDERTDVRFVDLSENSLEKRVVEALVPALQQQQADEAADVGKKKASGKGVETLRLDGCALRGGALEALAQGVRHSSIRHLSLRNNRIPSLGGVAVAVLIKDYPDASTTTSSPFGALSGAGGSSSATTTVNYTPYTPRSRRSPEAGPQGAGPPLPEIPTVASNLTGGITRRIVPDNYRRPGMDSSSSDSSSGSSGSSDTEDEDGVVGPKSKSSAQGAGKEDAVGRMMQSRVRALDDVQRVGRLVTLDLKGNDLRSGVTYIAQVLKRNRTLKVCNLADNKIDVAGLVALAEALKYNSTLDTLDLTGNPCCGPALEGIHALRHAFTLNANLSRLLLASTGLTTAGAIALAEFLPEATHLLHLDLTVNPAIGTAGVMALAVGLRANHIVRCLDLSVAVGDEVGLGWSRDILQSCIRNTELAQNKSLTKAARLAVWQPIQKSTLARLAKAADSARALAEVAAEAATPAGQARVAVFELGPDEVEEQAEQVVQSLADGVEVRDALGVVVVADVQAVVERAKVLRERLEEMVQQAVDVDSNGGDNDRLQVLLGLSDRLTAQLDKAEQALKEAVDKERTRVAQEQEAKLNNAANPATESPAPGGLFPPNATDTLTPAKSSTSEPLSSPNFSIGDSDDDNDSSDDGGQEVDALVGGVLASNGPDSPTNTKSSRWVEEEGEIFRKGVVLGAAEVDDEEDAEAAVSGEELKKELLHTDVQRQSPRRLSVDETTLPAEPAE